MHVRDATPADQELVARLRDTVKNLPENLQAKIFHDLQDQVRASAENHQATNFMGCETALRVATRDHINEQALTAALQRSPEPERPTSPSFAPEDTRAVESEPELLAALRSRYGEEIVAALRWPNDDVFWLGNYLSCAELDGRSVFVVGGPILRTDDSAYEYGPAGVPFIHQANFRQLGTLYRDLDYVREMHYYEIDPVALSVRFIGSHDVHWNDYEAVSVTPRKNFDRLPDGVAKFLGGLCERWLTSQVVRHIIPFDLDDIDYQVAMRGMSKPDQRGDS